MGCQFFEKEKRERKFKKISCSSYLYVSLILLEERERERENQREKIDSLWLTQRAGVLLCVSSRCFLCREQYSLCLRINSRISLWFLPNLFLSLFSLSRKERKKEREKIIEKIKRNWSDLVWFSRTRISHTRRDTIRAAFFFRNANFLSLSFSFSLVLFLSLSLSLSLSFLLLRICNSLFINFILFRVFS